ncbi:MAG TPA: copper transporter [Jiangellaceae bacterium]|nr:copper transporter [Jiangellaceae bacterium]
MIDFRYHLVSIIAIFFALATGIVLGAGPLDEQVDATLADQIPELREENQQLRDQIVALEASTEYQETFIQTVMPQLVGNRLSDREILLVTLPGADEGEVSGVRDTLEAAGAAVQATAAIQPAWTDAESEAVLDELAVQLVSSGTTLPEDTDGYDRAAAVLAGALLAPTGEQGTVDDAVTTGFGAEELGLVTIEPASDSEPLAEATLAVVVAGPPPEDDADRSNGILRALVSQLDAAGAGAVVGGGPSSSGDGSLLAAIRSDTDVSEAVSTVDSIDLASGRVTVVLATVEQEQGGAGSYGKVGTTDGVLPPDVLTEPAEPSDQPTGEGESSP